MSIKVKIPSHMQPFANDTEVVEVNGRTVGECLKHLGEQFPHVGERLFDKQGKLFVYFNIYVNGESAYPERLDKPVKDGDEIRIVLFLAGG